MTGRAINRRESNSQTKRPPTRRSKVRRAKGPAGPATKLLGNWKMEPGTPIEAFDDQGHPAEWTQLITDFRTLVRARETECMHDLMYRFNINTRTFMPESRNKASRMKAVEDQRCLRMGWRVLRCVFQVSSQFGEAFCRPLAKVESYLNEWFQIDRHVIDSFLLLNLIVDNLICDDTAFRASFAPDDEGLQRRAAMWKHESLESRRHLIDFREFVMNRAGEQKRFDAKKPARRRR